MSYKEEFEKSQTRSMEIIQNHPNSTFERDMLQAWIELTDYPVNGPRSNSLDTRQTTELEALVNYHLEP